MRTGFNNPDLLLRCADSIKLAIMRKQRTLADLANDSWLPRSLHGLRGNGRPLYRSSVFSPRDLDMLYSEVVLLPV
ncbi:MAG TPA: hypothetical protein VHY82_08665 [Acetobacteraceae bacterium]|nr:hypothetical protein [Acetobacteraceae bacterium]